MTRFPEEAKSTLIVRAKQPVDMSIGIRVPGWCKKGVAIAVNGKLADIAVDPGSYAVIKRTWKSGDRIEIRMPMAFSTYPMPDKKNQLAFLYGPLVMVGEAARPWLGELVGDLDDPEGWVHQLDAWFKPVGGDAAGPRGQCGPAEGGRVQGLRAGGGPGRVDRSRRDWGLQQSTIGIHHSSINPACPRLTSPHRLAPDPTAGHHGGPRVFGNAGHAAVQH